jgi:hypothetical protein
MVDATFAPERASAARDVQRFGTIVVVGGGCYGSYYVRQLLRAHRAGALAWERLIVVDRDARCRIAGLASEERPPALELAVGDWREWFGRYLAAAAEHRGTTAAADAIVPSPLMPHLMADWLAERAAARWPGRQVASTALGGVPTVPWQRTGDDATHYVSFAEWMCPINCVEPPRCPHTRGERSWTMPEAVRDYVTAEVAAGRPVEGPYVFQCLHRAYGVGMIDVRDVLAADETIAARGAAGAASFLIGTVSHCHGALRQMTIGST